MSQEPGQKLVEAEKAAFIQAVKALYIPLSLFLACVISAAGVFLVYSNLSLGWIFIFASALIIVSAFIALIKFQNQYRVKGLVGREEAEEDDLISSGQKP